MRAKQLLNFLQGEWSITKHITIIDTNQQIIKANGLASFCALENNSNRIVYTENLTLRYCLTQNLGLGHQSYIYTYDLRKDSVATYFTDGRMFYSLDLAGNSATGTYQCIDDLYMAKYHFVNQTSFELTYSITGPKKNYSIKSAYRKLFD